MPNDRLAIILTEIFGEEPARVRRISSWPRIFQAHVPISRRDGTYMEAHILVLPISGFDRKYGFSFSKVCSIYEALSEGFYVLLHSPRENRVYDLSPPRSWPERLLELFKPGQKRVPVQRVLKGAKGYDL